MSSEPAEPQPSSGAGFSALTPEKPTTQTQLVEELQQSLVAERDARAEDRFVFIVVCVMLLDVVFFTVMPSFGGPLALLILELLVLVPLAKRMGMQEIAKLLDRVLSRMIPAGKTD
jgi:hypothetical protein